jgi:hypothetical protein
VIVPEARVSHGEFVSPALVARTAQEDPFTRRQVQIEARARSRKLALLLLNVAHPIGDDGALQLYSDISLGLGLQALHCHRITLPCRRQRLPFAGEITERDRRTHPEQRFRASFEHDAGALRRRIQIADPDLESSVRKLRLVIGAVQRHHGRVLGVDLSRRRSAQVRRVAPDPMSRRARAAPPRTHDAPFR